MVLEALLNLCFLFLKIWLYMQYNTADKITDQNGGENHKI